MRRSFLVSRGKRAGCLSFPTSPCRLVMNLAEVMSALEARSTARHIGARHHDRGDTVGQVPAAELTLLKSRRGASIAPKRKITRC